jgi:radical SAM protein with 4Fe4S-binding SPASM domain
MFDSQNYSLNNNNEMNVENKLKLIDQIHDFVLKFNTVGAVAITGGDPLLCPHLWETLAHIDKYKERISIPIMMGNSFNINFDTAKRLKSYGVSRYQISIDGLKETHDFIRKPGSYDDIFRALECLKSAGLETVLMFTLSKKNANELISLMKILDSVPTLDYFLFDRLVPTGSAEKNFNADDLFSAHEYREFLLSVMKFEIYEKSRLFCERKDNLWKLFYSDLNLIDPIDNLAKTPEDSGCPAGIPTIAILPDGTICACTKMDLVGGTFPHNSLLNLIKFDEHILKLKEWEKYENCNTCHLLNYCRGCPAMKHIVNGDIFSKDPYCWRT